MTIPESSVNYQSPIWEKKYLGIKERVEIEAARTKIMIRI